MVKLILRVLLPSLDLIWIKGRFAIPGHGSYGKSMINWVDYLRISHWLVVVEDEWRLAGRREGHANHMFGIRI